ncbi:hypothetical protein [Ferruginivarius sediminum]|uniref:Uncharacterized protein n=1 Tax=Ferruginivarius sediminum TaxID=2661937 RepID=A0A369T984_9PROT|nr:hypothetical protein [Ferruginivarius sediminum]RDD61044.1 hypothetical protein DRB17_15075 [Ferruginivarius sediminum]
MTDIVQGQRFWKHGDHRHVWIVDAVLSRPDGEGQYAILVAEHGDAEEEVDMERLRDRAYYTRVPEDPHLVSEE